MSYEFHTEIIANIAREMRPEVYVELGVWNCDTFKRVLPYASQAYAIDMRTDLGSLVPQQSNAHARPMTTDAFYHEWKEKGELIDLIFIDADHSERAVYSDVMNFWPFLVKDKGLMILHDTWPPTQRHTEAGYCGDGYKVKPLLKHVLKDAEFVTLPCQYGLTLIRKLGGDWRNG